MASAKIEVEHALAAVEAGFEKLFESAEGKYGPQVVGGLRKLVGEAKGFAAGILHQAAGDVADATETSVGGAGGSFPTPTPAQSAGAADASSVDQGSTPASTGDETAAPATDSPSGADVPVESDQPVSDAASGHQSAAATNEQAPPVS